MVRKIFYSTFLLLLNVICFGQQPAEMGKFDNAYLGEVKSENAALGERIKTFPKAVQVFNQKVAQLIRSGNYNEALNLTIEIDSLYPDLADIKNFKGKLWSRQNNLIEAVIAFNEAIKLNPENKWFYIYAATSLAQQGKHEMAIEKIDKLILKSPEWSIGYNIKAAILHDAGRHQEALQAYNKAINASPKSAQILTNRGDLYLFLNQKELALSDYQAALKLQPDYEWAKTKLDTIK
ncbi:tetratricopeptide repeat protein [Pedobacter nototheniae]|uniref:tetratricopeptide repeat protein n=1 Tax=Pedobacter nototheniae TaxID=2488994 RepID=UPI00292E9BFB|nr:tetratricopeptide repeat protein [Pedobacter nototheniae]